MSPAHTHTYTASYNYSCRELLQKKSAEVADPRYVDCIPGDPTLWGHHLLVYVHKQLHYLLTTDQTLVMLNKYNLIVWRPRGTKLEEAVCFTRRLHLTLSLCLKGRTVPKARNLPYGWRAEEGAIPNGLLLLHGSRSAEHGQAALPSSLVRWNRLSSPCHNSRENQPASTQEGAASQDQETSG